AIASFPLAEINVCSQSPISAGIRYAGVKPRQTVMRFRNRIRNLVAHSIIQRQLGGDLEFILSVKTVVVPLVTDVDSHAQVGAFDHAEQKTGPGMATGSGDIGRVGGGLRIEFKQTRTILAASNVELLTTCFGAELQAVSSVDPGEVLAELRRLVDETRKFRATRNICRPRPAEPREGQVWHIRQTQRARLVLSQAGRVYVARIRASRQTVVEMIQQVR